MPRTAVAFLRVKRVMDSFSGPRQETGQGNAVWGLRSETEYRLWKYCLQAFSKESGLTIHVSHFPLGTSKWNKIEHRLFNHISMNWKGQPLVSMDVIVNLIGNITSQMGLKVYAMEDQNIYPIKRKITDEAMEGLNIIRDAVLGKWNHKIMPGK